MSKDISLTEAWKTLDPDTKDIYTEYRAILKRIEELEAENARLREAILEYLRDSNLASREKLRSAALKPPQEDKL